MKPAMPWTTFCGLVLLQCLNLAFVESFPIIENCLVHHTTVNNILVCLQCESNHIPLHTDGTRCETVRNATDLISCPPLDNALNCNSRKLFCGPRSIYEGGLDFGSELISVCPIESCCSHTISQYPFGIRFHECNGHCTSEALNEYKKRRGIQPKHRRAGNYGEYFKTSVDDISIEATKSLAYMDDKLSVQKISAVDFVDVVPVRADAFRRTDKMLEISSASDLDSIMNLKVSVRGTYGLFSGEASAKVSRSMKVSTTSKSYYRYISQQSGLHSFPIEDLQILPDAVELLKTPGGVDEFIQLHGRYFVAGYFTACEVEMVQSISCQSSRGLLSIEAEANMKYGNPLQNVEASVKFDKSIEQSSETCTRSEDVYLLLPTTSNEVDKPTLKDLESYVAALADCSDATGYVTTIMLGSYLRIPHFRDLIGKHEYIKFDADKTNMGIYFEAYEMFSEANGYREKLEHDTCNIYNPLCLSTINFDKFDVDKQASLYARFFDFTREIEGTSEEEWKAMESDGTPEQLREWRFTLSHLRWEFDRFINGVPGDTKYFTLLGVKTQNWNLEIVQKIMLTPRLLNVDPEHVYEKELDFFDKAGGNKLKTVYYRYKLDFTGAVPWLSVQYDRQSLGKKQEEDKFQSNNWMKLNLRELLSGRVKKPDDVEYSSAAGWQFNDDILYIFKMYVAWGAGFPMAEAGTFEEAGIENDEPKREDYDLQPRAAAGEACTVTGACLKDLTCEEGVCKNLAVNKGGKCSVNELCVKWLTCEEGICKAPE